MSENSPHTPKSLITGVGGFIGSHVAEECLKMGHDVVGVDDLSGGYEENVPAGVEFVKASIADAVLVDGLFQQHKFDYVYHMAAYAAEGLSHFIRIYNYQENLVASMSLINAAVNYGVKRFVFTSSIAAYGTGNPPYTEEQQLQPEDPYGISKYAVEMDLKAAHAMFGLDYTIFRPHNVYGERQNIADAYRNVVCIFLNQALQGKELTIFGDGEQTRAFSYISDVAPVIADSVNLVAARNEIVNVGAKTAYSVNDLADAITKALGKNIEVNHLPARHEVVHATSCVEKMIRIFDLDPENFVSLEEGIQRVAAWAKNRGPTQPICFQAVEVDRKLPASWRTPNLKRLPNIIRDA